MVPRDHCHVNATHTRYSSIVASRIGRDVWYGIDFPSGQDPFDFVAVQINCFAREPDVMNLESRRQFGIHATRGWVFNE